MQRSKGSSDDHWPARDHQYFSGVEHDARIFMSICYILPDDVFSMGDGGVSIVYNNDTHVVNFNISSSIS